MKFLMRRIFLMFGVLASATVQSQQVGTGIGTVISALDANTTSIQPTGYYSIKNGINFPATTRTEPWHHFVAFNHGNNNGYQLQLTAPYSNPDNALYFRTVANGSYASWQRVATENSNTFKAAQYFPGSGVWNATGSVGIGTSTVTASMLYVKGDASRDAAVFELTHPYGLKDGVVGQTSIDLNTTTAYNTSLFKAKFLSSKTGYAFTAVRDNQLNFSINHLGDGYFRGKLNVDRYVGIGKHNPIANIDIYHASEPVSIGLQTKTEGKFWIVSQNNELQIGGVSSSMPTQGALSIGIDHVVKVYTKLEAQKIEVKNMTLPDYVFADDYKLRSLSEVETFIDENSHLPEVPSAAHVAENGMDLTEMNNVMLKKIEELTLYLIEQDKKISALQKQNEQLLQSINK